MTSQGITYMNVVQFVWRLKYSASWQVGGVPKGNKNCSWEESKTTQELYRIVKSKLPDYCDDTERCHHHKLIPARQPEWKHALRNAHRQLKKKDR